MPRSSRVGGGQHVALVEQPGVRLRRRQVAEVVQHLVPEAGVQQVQHGVLDAADVQVDAAGVVGPHVGLRAHPVPLDRRVDERASRWSGRSSAARTSTSRPTAASRWCRGGSACGPSPRSSSTSTQPVRRSSGLSGSENSSSGSNVRGEKLSVSGSVSGSIVVGQGVRAAVGVVDDRERLAPVALAAEQPVAQLVGDRSPRRGRSASSHALIGGDALGDRRRCRSRSSVVVGRVDVRRVADERLRPAVGVERRRDAGARRTTRPAGAGSAGMSRPNARANSKSRWSPHGTAMIAPVP